MSVTGTAEQDYLKSGVTVEFVAEVDKTHTVKDKIDQTDRSSRPPPIGPRGSIREGSLRQEKKAGKRAPIRDLGGDMLPSEKSDKPVKAGRTFRSLPAHSPCGAR